MDRSSPRAAAEVAAYPGYVRFILPTAAIRAAQAWRKFAAVCTEESTGRALIVTAGRESSPEDFGREMARAARRLPRGFRLAVVASGRDTTRLTDAATYAAATASGRARTFRSEHRAAAWLMGE